jgi:ribonuclease-3
MDRPSLAELGARLGIALRDPEAIRQAFVHSSYFNENQLLVAGHNERLEFLGDAVIGLVVSRLLYDRYPDEDEGLLTARRAGLVNRDALARMALRTGMDRYLLLGRGESEAGGATRPSLLAALFEAVAGAVYLAEGLPATRRWLLHLFVEELDGPERSALKSAKSRLQEWSQRVHRQKPRYELLETEGPPHDQRFRVAVLVNGRRIAEGSGSSRQRAEEHAASRAMDDAHRPPLTEEPAL